MCVCVGGGTEEQGREKGDSEQIYKLPLNSREEQQFLIGMSIKIRKLNKIENRDIIKKRE